MQKLRFGWTLMAMMALALLPVAGFAGSISGKVDVKGLRTPANILVYLSKAPAAKIDLTGAKFVMDQRNLAFLPHILPVPVGAQVQFPNHDKVDHNVFSPSLAKKFNLGSYKPGEVKTVVFDKPGIVELRCDVHAEMLAYILVLKNPYFAVTDTDGNFAIPDSDYFKRIGAPLPPPLPAGKYSVKTWHEKLKSERTVVEVSDPASGQLNMILRRGTPSVLYK